MSKPFFLTRQTANLMEDFVRELKQGSALFLLYGDTGVGKTRVLRELSETRLSDRAIYWIDLDSEDGSDETRMDRSAEVEALFSASGNGDIIIADHFEMALKKTRHQLFLSWSTDGIDKQLSLIIASSTDGFNELRQLAQQYQVRVQSFHQMPLSADEVKAFLGFHLFPDNPTGKLSIPSPLRKQIAATQGIIGDVVKIVERDGAQIESAPPAQEASTRQGSRMIVALVVVSVLALGIGWYLTRQAGLFESPLIAAESSEVGDGQTDASVGDGEMIERGTIDTGEPAGIAAGEADSAAAAVVTDTEPADETLAQAGPAAAENETPDMKNELQSLPAKQTETAAGETMNAAETSDSQSRVMPEDATVVAADTGQAVAGPTQVVPATEAETAAREVANDSEAAALQAQTMTTAEPGTASDTDAVIDESSLLEQDQPIQEASNDSYIEQLAAPKNHLQRFELELKQSMNWLKQQDDTVGTIQILLLRFENFDPENYYEYVDNLARKQVDTERLHVFRTLTGSREVYSVVYGEFDTRKSAQSAIDSLPPVLRDISPLGRSVGGLWQEIRRLESRN